MDHVCTNVTCKHTTYYEANLCHAYTLQHLSTAASPDEFAKLEKIEFVNSVIDKHSAVNRNWLTDI